MKIIFSIIILSVFFSCAKKDAANNPIVAKIGRATLTLNEAKALQLAVSNENYSLNDVVSDWVDRELLFKAAKQGGFENDKTIKSQVAIYRKDLLGKAFRDNYINSQTKISNIAVKTYYDKYRDSFKRSRDEAKVMHFFLPNLQDALTLVQELKLPSTASNKKELLLKYGVDVTIVEKGRLIPKLDNEIFSTSRTNYIVGPIISEHGYHVVEVLNRHRAGSQIAFNEAYDEVYQRLLNQKSALLANAYLDSLRNHYSVKLYLENIK